MYLYKLCLRYGSFLLLLLGMCASFPLHAQVNEKAVKSDSLANVFIQDGKYEDAITMLNRTVSMLDENNPDSLYIQSFVKMGYCYDCLNNPMKAIEMTKLASFLRQSAGMPENLYQANMYDNIALGYHKVEMFTVAQEWIDKALQISARYPKALDIRARHLSHASIIAKSLDHLQQAVELQQQVIDLSRQSQGKYSEAHLESLSVLRTLYDAMADSAHYHETSQQIRNLRDDIAQGVLPEPTDLSTARLCRKHNTDALLCSRWILGNYVNTEGMKQAVEFLSAFYRHTPDVAIYIGKAENRWTKNLNSVYLMAYIAASCDYALRHPNDLRYSVFQYKYAMNRVLDYYEANKKITGTIPVFESYQRQRERSEEKFDQELSKNFRDYIEMMRSKKPFDFEVEAPTIMKFSY